MLFAVGDENMYGYRHLELFLLELFMLELFLMELLMCEHKDLILHY